MDAPRSDLPRVETPRNDTPSPKAEPVKPGPKEKRVALIVGNSAYVEADSLRNPVSDAARMQIALHRLGFELIVGQDLSLSAFNEKLREFVRASRNADVALFFYAGHGVQYGDRNYLLPTDITLASQQDVVSKSVPLDDILSKMSQAAKISVIFLDACRDSPEFRGVARGPAAATGSWRFHAGLAAIRPPARDHFIGLRHPPARPRWMARAGRTVPSRKP